MSTNDESIERLARKRVAELQEDELLLFLRETTTHMIATIDRLEALSPDGRDTGAGQDPR